MTIKRISYLLTCVVSFLISSTSYASLESRLGGNAYYDNVADLTWSQDASIFTPANWQLTQDNLIGLDINGVTGWRLPTADLSCGHSTACATSELGNMFYNVLGGTAGTSLSASHNANYDLFTGIISFYWTSDEYAADPFFGIAYSFYTSTAGKQSLNNKAYSRGGWAVYTGDVGLEVTLPPLPGVPVPASIWLFTSALLGLLSFRAKKKSFKN